MPVLFCKHRINIAYHNLGDEHTMQKVETHTYGNSGTKS